MRSEVSFGFEVLRDIFHCYLVANPFTFPADGFNRVFRIEKLSAFTPEEIKVMLCGDQSPRWTREDIIAYTEPKLGFTKERYAFDCN